MIRKSITWDDIEVLFVGAGTMGASLAQAYAQSGFNVGVIDISQEILDRARERINSELESAERAGIFSGSQVEDIKRRILSTTDYEEACQGKSLKLVVETATENMNIKKKIFKTLDSLCAPDVVFASNSSSLDTNILVKETNRPDKVVWMHYFYLPHKNRAGEYAGTDTASPESIELAAKYMKLSGKVATPILSSRKGGAADVIFVSLLLEAARMVDEGFDTPSIEAAGRAAFNIPIGFLGLMDHTGIPLGIITMHSFSDDTNPDDPLYKTYRNFFAPAESYKNKMKVYQEAEDQSRIKWVSEEDAEKEPLDPELVQKLRDRFLSVGFMTAAEVVDAGVINLEEVDKLCQNAFLWQEGPFALMNKMGIDEVIRLVKERKEVSQQRGIHFPIPGLLIAQAQKNEPWPMQFSPVQYTQEKQGQVARIMISHPRSANALENKVFEDIKASFQRANQDGHIKAIIFDSAPIKTFISGVNVSGFIADIKEGDIKGIKQDTAKWQDILFHEITGSGKPKVVIVDGAASGGGVEVVLAFILDPDSVVIITDRTSFSFPETRWGIYPLLRGTLTLPRAIYRATGDPEMAVALARYYILAGGTTTMPPRVIKHLGIADFMVPAKNRDQAADTVIKAFIHNRGLPLAEEEQKSLNIDELPSELTTEEKEELRWIKKLFLKADLASALHAGNIRLEEIFSSPSPHAVKTADQLISRGFDGFLEGKSLDELAQSELDHDLELTFQHPDALEGLTAHVERRPPKFNRG